MRVARASCCTDTVSVYVALPTGGALLLTVTPNKLLPATINISNPTNGRMAFKVCLAFIAAMHMSTLGCAYDDGLDVVAGQDNNAEEVLRAA